LLDQAALLIRDARDLSPERAVGSLKESVALLEAVRPCKERDSMMALAYLRLAQVQRQLGKRNEAERAYMLGYSYARSSREERVRRLAEKLSLEFTNNTQG
jgi:predicted Zn-dependent protease